MTAQLCGEREREETKETQDFPLSNWQHEGEMEELDRKIRGSESSLCESRDQ